MINRKSASGIRRFVCATVGGMANELSISWDTERLGAFRGQGIEKAIARALMKSGRDGLRQLKSASSKSVRFRKRIKVSRVNKAMTFGFPTSKEIPNMEWRLNVTGEPIPLVDFPHSQTRRGISVAVNAGKRVLIKSAFEATMKSGHTGIFQRLASGLNGPLTKKQSRSKDRFLVGRLPIKELFSTRITDVFHDEGMIPAVMGSAMKTFNETFDRVLPLEIAKEK